MKSAISRTPTGSGINGIQISTQKVLEVLIITKKDVKSNGRVHLHNTTISMNVLTNLYLFYLKINVYNYEDCLI